VTTTRPREATGQASGELRFAVRGMTCGACAARVQRVMERADGVSSAEVNLATGTATARGGSPEALEAAVERAGYELVPLARGELLAGDDEAVRRRRAWGLRAAAAAPAAVVLGAGMLAGDRLMDLDWFRWLSFGLATLVQFGVGWPFLREAARRARHLGANMDTLVSVGTLSAYVASVAALLGWVDLGGGMGGPGRLWFETSVLVITFVSLGRYLEARATSSAGRSAPASAPASPSAVPRRARPGVRVTCSTPSSR